MRSAAAALVASVAGMAAIDEINGKNTINFGASPASSQGSGSEHQFNNNESDWDLIWGI